jgi:hypothetical protein
VVTTFTAYFGVQEELFVEHLNLYPDENIALN